MASAWIDLLDGIKRRLENQGLGGRVGFGADLVALGQLSPRTTAETGRPLPVQRHWPAAGAGDELGRWIAEIGQDLGTAWRQNPNYRAAPPSTGFLDNYGYLECAGPEAPYCTPHLRLGLLLLGPRTLYPQHHHPAEEIYLPLGPGRWWKDGEGWQARVAGDVIHHPPMCGHATESGDAPLAAIYLWRGEIARAAEIG
ncbi:dimethylsulfonioproprionate lyase family protein [Dongia sp.]|uniref:dimethylsulfonioproprionate lyase family protein n=1 Tax=Dongia sp. TaxID=1977262 RepID=UPI0035B0B171